MNYLEEYKKLKKAADDKKLNYNRYLSDMTYTIFEEFIMDVLPLSIEKTLKIGTLSKKDKVSISFEITNKYYDHDENRIGNLIYNDKDYGYINILEFFTYLEKIPGYSSVEITNRYHYNYKLGDIITYYYEKLQEYEHFNLIKKINN